MEQLYANYETFVFCLFNKANENISTNLHGKAVSEGAPCVSNNVGANCGARTEGAPCEAKREISSCGAGRQGTSRRVSRERASCGSGCRGGILRNI